MSVSGIFHPGPPVLKPRRAGKPGQNLSGHTLKPKANSRRVRVMDARKKRLIRYFDLMNEDGRPQLPERVCINLFKVAAKAKRHIEAVPVHVMLTKCGKYYLEVHDPSVIGNCIIEDVLPDQHRLVKDGALYVLGQDDYFYRLVDEESLQKPILSFANYWDAERVLKNRS